MRHYLLLACFFTSGLCGLVYQIVWLRLIGRVFGNSVFATATVLAAFMAGLALGSFLGGRAADRREDRVRLYGILEVAIGLYCVVLPLLLALASPLYAAVYQKSEGASTILILIRAVICGTILLVPTTCMGATLPLLLRHFVRTRQGIGRTVGLVYAINTFGAAAGSALTGFFLIPTLGVKMTTGLAAFLNIAVGAAAILFLQERKTTESAKLTPETGSPGEPPASSSYSSWEVRCALIAIGGSGFVAMAYEVALTRTFSLLLGSSTYAFSLMLTAFILGIGLGSIALTRWVRPDKDLLLGLGLTQMGIGVSSFVMVILIGEIPALVVSAIAKSSDSFGSLQLAEFLFLFATMLVPTSLMGLMFPLVTAIRTRAPQGIGRSSGEVYSVNTLGAILGSVAAGFVFLPLWGIQATIERMAFLNFIIAVLVLSASGRRRPVQRFGLAAVTVILGLVIWRGVPTWNLEEFTSGPYLYAASAARSGEDPEVAVARAATQQGTILWNRDGTACTVTVKKLGEGLLQLSVNGKIDATSDEDQKTQKLIGHVPMLLHPSPKNVLVIGLGSGMTLASALRHDPERADFVEISTDVIFAAENFFRTLNDDAVNDARTHQVIGDGRNHVILTRRAYDIIASEPSNPWIAGIGDLFTKEYWEACRDRLRDHGVMCQWLQAYQISEETFRLVVRTYQSVFPHCSLWYTAGNDVLLLGSKSPVSLDLALLRERIGRDRVAEDLRKVGIWDAESFLAHFIAGSEGVRSFAGSGSHLLVHTDDNSRLEFDMPREMFCDSSVLFRRIERLLESPAGLIDAQTLDVDRRTGLGQCQRTMWHMNQARNHLRAGQTELAFAGLDRAREAAGDDPGAVLGLFEFLADRAQKLFRQQRPPQGRECVRRLVLLYPAIEAARKQRPQSPGRIGAAERAYRAALDLDGRSGLPPR